MYEPGDRSSCRKCRTTKKQEEFYFNNLVEDGLTTYCRACQADKGSPTPGPDGSMPVRSGTRYNTTVPTKTEKMCKCAFHLQSPDQLLIHIPRCLSALPLSRV